MTRYTMYKEKPEPNPAKKPVHPVWKGIGCALMILIPFVSYVAGDYFVNNARLYKWIVIPEEMVIRQFKDPLILVKLLYMAIFVAILYLLLTIVTFFFNRFFGPPRYGPYDVPLDKVEKK